MRTKIIVRSFEEVLQLLRNAQFDVRALPAVAGRGGETAPVRSPTMVSKYGAAAVMSSNPAYTPKTAGEQHPVLWVTPPGWLLRGHIARLVDHGNQKLFETADARVAATADALKAIHRFSEELRDVIGEPSLYNQSLGTVSDLYLYDRVRGREEGHEETSGH